MTPLELVETAAERFHQQWTTGEWEGPGQVNWLTNRMPCGRLAEFGRKCPCHDLGRGYRGLPPWSQVLSAPEPPSKEKRR